MSKKARAVTPAQIEAWKQQYGVHKIYEIVVPVPVDGDPDKTEEFTCIVRKPGLDEVLAGEEFSKGDTVQQNLFLFKQCYLGGDPEIQSEDELRMSAANQTAALFKIYKATAKKL